LTEKRRKSMTAALTKAIRNHAICAPRSFEPHGSFFSLHQARDSRVSSARSETYRRTGRRGAQRLLCWSARPVDRLADEGEEDNHYRSQPITSNAAAQRHGKRDAAAKADCQHGAAQRWPISSEATASGWRCILTTRPPTRRRLNLPADISRPVECRGRSSTTVYLGLA